MMRVHSFYIMAPAHLSREIGTNEPLSWIQESQDAVAKAADSHTSARQSGSKPLLFVAELWPDWSEGYPTLSMEVAPLLKPQPGQTESSQQR